MDSLAMKEETIALIDKLPQNKLEYIWKFSQFLSEQPDTRSQEYNTRTVRSSDITNEDRHIAAQELFAAQKLWARHDNSEPVDTLIRTIRRRRQFDI